MTVLLDIANRALQIAQTKTSMSATEFANQTSNEAIQVNLVIYSLRDQLLRMAPWNCALNFNNLQYITSTPGTPENPSQITQTWIKGQPAPPWSYEYAFPSDCIRPLWIIPWLNTGFAGGIPITTAVTNVGGGSPTNFGSPAVPFKVGIDQFYAVSAVSSIASAGTGYAVGDLIYLNPGNYGPSNIPSNTPPVGAPAILQVTGIGAGGTVTGVSVVNTFPQAQPENSEPCSGSYFSIQSNPMAQATTSGSGTGASFNVTWTSQLDQRIILTGMEFATLAYIKQVTNPDTMDPDFIDAWVAIIASRVGPQLSGDKALSMENLQLANRIIVQARQNDANEGLTVNDVTPDFIRIRGGYGPNWEYSNSIGGFNWGPLFIA